MAEACVSRDGRRNIHRSRRARQAGAKSSETNGKRKQKTANQQQVGSPVILDSDGGNLKQLKPPPWRLRSEARPSLGANPIRSSYRDTRHKGQFGAEMDVFSHASSLRAVYSALTA